MAAGPALSVTVRRASAAELDRAWAMVEEYNQAIGVQVRDTPESFAASYFGEGGGVWLALVAVAPNESAIGCIALRPLPAKERAGEVKRLYVRPEMRGRGAADALLAALEEYARSCGYEWLYLDSKDDLQAALRFYTRHGYHSCERYNDNPQATIFLRKRLASPPR